MTTQHWTAAALLLAAASPALAADLQESIQATLDSMEKSLEETRLGKLQIHPTFRQSVIWTDNVYLNDNDEQPFVVTRAFPGSGGTIRDPKQLAALQRRSGAFGDLYSRGRVRDWISRSDLGASLELPMNPDYTKVFDTDRLTVLEARLRHNQYVFEDLDSTEYSFRTDVFGFLSDIFSFEQGNRFWVRGDASYEDLTEPLDTDIVELKQQGIEISQAFREFRRSEWDVNADAGYRYNRIDAFVGGGYTQRRFTDIELRQAEYDRWNVHAQIGYELPWFQDKTAYVRGDVDEYRPNDRAVDGATQALNDGDILRVVAGVEGLFFSKKVAGRIEAGYYAWVSDIDSGASGDTESLHCPAVLVELAYKPWEDARNTQVQLSYERAAEPSAIANFNSIHRGTISVVHDLIPKSLEGNLSFGVTRTDASEGPRSTLFDVGAGLSYQWFDQVTVSLRYSLRKNVGERELRITSSLYDKPTDTTFVYVSESDGDFYVNTVELGLEVVF